MAIALYIFAFFCFVAGIMILLYRPANKPQQLDPITPRAILTSRELIMFEHLQRAFPQHNILTQVSFNALISSEGIKTRNQFNRKMADFVIVNQHFDVIAIIELDDSSHVGREHTDKERDQMLQAAGYRVVRYTIIPTIQELQADAKDWKGAF